MKLLYGTGNPAKLAIMRQCLAGMDIEIIGLKDLGQKIPEVSEEGYTPLENAREKALAYYKAFHMPVFSCDSGLYFDNVPEKIQPGVHIRRVRGKSLSDEEMTAYYASLAEQYGPLTACYRNAICLVMDEEHIYEASGQEIETAKFLIISTPHPKTEKGFPLDRLSIDIKSGRYYYDIEDQAMDQVTGAYGTQRFFEMILRDQE